MPSSGKTQNFGLNQWIGTDSIKVADLNSDNRKIDEAAELLKKTPYIGGNGNWFIWDVDAGGYVDSGKTSVGKDGPQGPPGPAGGIAKINGILPDDTGEATLSASNVHARPDTWMPTAEEVGAVTYDLGTHTGSIVTVQTPRETTAAVMVYGKTKEVLADPNAEKSPDNPATITGVGENGSIELLSNGKNFWRTNITYPKTTNGVTLDYDTVEQTYTLNGTANGLAVFFVAQNGFFTGFRWKSSTKYSAKIYMQSGEKPSGVALNISSGRFNAESEFVMTEGSKATPQNMTQNLLRPSINVNSGITVNNLKFKVMFCEGEMPTVWEPYLQKKFLTTSFLPLYSLPDGTRDTLDVETGTITRRIGRRTFNGTEAWKKTGATNRNNFFLYDTSIKITFTNYDVPPIYCDKLSVLKLNDIMVSQDLTPNAIVYDEPTKDWRIALSPTIANTDSAFKMWLNQNPLTVIYALSEPTIEKVPPHLLPIYANTANIYTTDPLAPELTATVLEPRPVSSARRLDGYAAAQMSDLLARVQALESGTNLMTTIIADTAESEYQKAMEEINNV